MESWLQGKYQKEDTYDVLEEGKYGLEVINFYVNYKYILKASV